MEREGAQLTLHARLIAALERGAEVQEQTHELVTAHVAVDKALAATLASSRYARGQRARQRDVRNQTSR